MLLSKIAGKFFSSVLPSDQEIASIKTEDGEIDQWSLLSTTFHHSHYRCYPPNFKFCKNFIRKLIGIIEGCGEEVTEDLYNVYLGFLSTSEAQNGAFFRSFLIENYLKKDDWLILKESSNIISKGTTGLSAWQAAYFMSEWVMCNKDLFHKKSILELGSGTGLLGLAICKTCQVEKFIFTDHHGEVLKMLGENLSINGWMQDGNDEVEGYEGMHKKDYLPVDSNENLPSTTVAFLDWEEVSDDNLDEITKSLDVIVASDVVFDTRIIPCLVRVLERLLHPSTVLPHSVTKTKAAYICGAIRNERTWDSFLKECGLRSLNVEIVPFSAPDEQERLFEFVSHSLEFQIVKLTSR